METPDAEVEWEEKMLTASECASKRGQSSVRKSGDAAVPLPAGYSSVSSSCFYCCVWGGLSVFWQFVEFSLLWSFLTVGGK